MGLQEEQTTSHAFVLALLNNLEAHASTPKELEIVVEQILPVLVPAIVHLLKAVEASEERDEDSEDVGPPIRPLDHLARFMLRRNPRHNDSTAEMIELQALARRVLRK
ncbi:hypothetical protein F441_15732 [Phytophthora nicotianae CJ01A1]|uniref:Uncharacterized protein n=6 Tax=Phytophthora nicotianae TaxID=4792 RepID=W2R2S3_PHYN3|nr:hypothetical protein PPTG_04909 [Phytophthora nicotianae INRA-310]ETI38298.1 hypothetical protein F443_15897 [Phytophthora nicotianae P1569]ETK78536.1 hypothetical protein L915_15450 [Phytophthora nicotianae]ETO67068.1 hypothetical protein F444_15881 [Phytophthora nicotianae P1976]ETP08224.1 hypothetical protein F441_15732 [Phytophthora nicotianae CJ01A1]ETP36289.1 hypothetical protein F442_15741 [Phytophthora nicotianae P10297]KUF90601.1 hypothetical protein AM587_10017088 [Phytophthora n